MLDTILQTVFLGFFLLLVAFFIRSIQKAPDWLRYGSFAAVVLSVVAFIVYEIVKILSE